MPISVNFGSSSYFNSDAVVTADASLGVTAEHIIETQLNMIIGFPPQNILNSVINSTMASFNVVAGATTTRNIPTTHHLLTPKPLNRQNFCQLRGSQLPKWFPGTYIICS